jgi:hypothetical protein
MPVQAGVCCNQKRNAEKVFTGYQYRLTSELKSSPAFQ